MSDSHSEDKELNFMQWANVSRKFKWLYEPHRVIAALLFLFALLFFRPRNFADKFIFVWVVSSLLLAIFLQDGPLVRPHPFLWRVVLSMVLLLVIFLICLCMVDRQVIVDTIASITPGKAGNVTEDRDYSQKCDIYDKSKPEDPFHNLRPVLFDVFVPAHFFGWIVQAMILRNTQLCWTVSILFEVCERMLKHWFPNFNECWWDSLIADILVCNGIGIFIGMKLVNYLSLKAWDTRLIDDCKGPEKITRIFNQFTPISYKRYDWRPLASWRRYFVYVFIIINHLALEVNLFGLKMVLQMKTSNPIVVGMLLIHLFVGIPSVLDYYLYATGERNSIGSFGCACFLLIIVEFALTVLNGKSYFSNPSPPLVRFVFWSIFACVLIFPVIWFLILKKGEKPEKVHQN